MRPWAEHERAQPSSSQALSEADAASRFRTGAGRAHLLELQRSTPRGALVAAREVVGPISGREGRRARWPPCGRRGRPRTRWRRRSSQARSPLIGRTEAEVSAEISARLVEPGSRPGELRHRRERPELRQPAPRAGSARHRSGRGRRLRLRRLAPPRRQRRLLLGHHPHGRDRRARAGVPRALRGASASRSRRRGGGRGRHRLAKRWTGPAGEPIAAAGYGESFIHRIGHGIGIEEHEDPYLVAGNATPLVAGHAFSVEPGIYLARQFRRQDRGHRRSDRRRPAFLQQADHFLVGRRGLSSGRARPVRPRARSRRGPRRTRSAMVARSQKGRVKVDLGLDGRVAVVAASSKGLGRASADALAAEGVRLVISARGAEALAAPRRHCVPKAPRSWRSGPTSRTRPCPSSSSRRPIEHFGRLDIIVAERRRATARGRA